MFLRTSTQDKCKKADFNKQLADASRTNQWYRSWRIDPRVGANAANITSVKKQVGGLSQLDKCEPDYWYSSEIKVNSNDLTRSSKAGY